MLRSAVIALVKSSTKRIKSSWTVPSCIPEWWPEELAWKNVRDYLLADLVTLLKAGYYYYGQEAKLPGKEKCIHGMFNIAFFIGLHTIALVDKQCIFNSKGPC